MARRTTSSETFGRASDAAFGRGDGGGDCPLAVVRLTTVGDFALPGDGGEPPPPSGRFFFGGDLFRPFCSSRTLGETFRSEASEVGGAAEAPLSFRDAASELSAVAAAAATSAPGCGVGRRDDMSS